jgi:5-methylthioadenosine/S-adenosylhomocysteine deaminase
MKFTAILNKVKRTDARVFPAWKMLRMATIEAAKVIGLESEIGSLRKGKKADIIIINLQEPNLSPVITDPIRNIAPNIVYSANGSEVETVIIDGQLIMDNRKILTVDEEKVVKQAQEAANTLAKRATEDVINSQSDIYKMMQEGYL